MKFLRKNIFLSLIFFLFVFCFLFASKETAEFAYIGLNTWFNSMIITLFPFLVLVNLLIQTGLSRFFIKPFAFLLKPIFKNTPDAIFVIFFGFLCGFPLGAKTAIDLYKKGMLSKTNTEYLLCFCNNIGPSYMIGFFMNQILPDSSLLYNMMIFYLIPLMYGLFLRYSIYKNKIDRECNAFFFCQKKLSPDTASVFSCFPNAIEASLTQIATLGGYMIFFNAIRTIPHLLLQHNHSLYLFSQGILEISGGLLCAKTLLTEGILQTLLFYAIFSFNGICCHFQTFLLMQDTPFEAKKYMLHKIILCSITVLSVFLSYIK